MLTVMHETGVTDPLLEPHLIPTQMLSEAAIGAEGPWETNTDAEPDHGYRKRGQSGQPLAPTDLLTSQSLNLEFGASSPLVRRGWRPGSLRSGSRPGTGPREPWREDAWSTRKSGMILASSVSRFPAAGGPPPRNPRPLRAGFRFFVPLSPFPPTA